MATGLFATPVIRHPLCFCFLYAPFSGKQKQTVWQAKHTNPLACPF
jgi:hypothetical protein